MTVRPGEEFNIKATPDPALQRKLLYLATQDNDSVLTGALKSPRHSGDSAKAGKGDRMAEAIQLLSMQEQARQERIQALNERLDALDRASFEALRKAEERLEKIRRTANRTMDGRLAFEDEDGKIYDEQGNEVGPDEIDWEKWDADAWKRRDFLKAQESMETEQERRRQIFELRENLENDPSADALDSIEDRVGALEAATADFESAGVSRQLAAGGREGAATRSTSATKLYEDAPSSNAANVNVPFSVAADPTPPAAQERPTITPVPNVPFTPD